MSRIKGGCLPAACSWCDVAEPSHHVLLPWALLGSVLSACQLTYVALNVSACPLAVIVNFAYSSLVHYQVTKKN